MKRSSICMLMCLWLSLSAAAAPPSVPASAAARSPATRPAVLPDQSDVLTFKDDSKSPITRLGSGARGTGNGPAVFLLVCAKPGRTIDARPTIYWYLTEDTEADIDLVVTEPGQIAPLYRRPLNTTGKMEKGLHGYNTADAGKELKAGVLYKVTLTVHDNPDDPSLDSFSIGFIERVEPPPALAETGSDQSPADYARAGLWYDALNSLCKRIERDPANSHLRNQRISLLQQEHVFLTFAPEQRWLSIPGVADARDHAALRELELLSEIAEQDRQRMRQ